MKKKEKKIKEKNECLTIPELIIKIYNELKNDILFILIINLLLTIVMVWGFYNITVYR